ncbi:hypothetical protein GFS24_17295 [Chitinophaga sp. SYP-B3965]|uniref:hypothetical protein n=1 Tax=Chitinophaga sp. SYP-B3965 TaxID=2663120 RepID=UPI001299C375|nr:hypothetical protein [Chitinophaga sp. SYP-B3965]MRG46880.1 hypothetical protein [Chitinophaga sp. SYP-B3965]
MEHLQKTYSFSVSDNFNSIKFSGTIENAVPETVIKGYENYLVFIVSFITDQFIESAPLKRSNNLMFLVGSGEDLKLGTIINDSFNELDEENLLVRGIKAKLLEIILISPSTGHLSN